MNSRLMRRGMSLVVVAALSSSLLCALAAPEALAGTSPQGTAFSYQGRLDVSGAPYSGTADLQFALWEVAAGAPQVGSTLAVNGITVNQGVFNVSLDFGALAFDGNARWLEISVHTPGNGGVGPYTTLTPRQRIETVPYAQYALNALIAGAQPNQLALNNTANTYSGSSMTLDGGTFHVDAANNRVGIGSTSPESKLYIGGPGGVVVDDGNSGYLLKANIGGSLMGGFQSGNVGVPNELWIENFQAGPIYLATNSTPGVAVNHIAVSASGRLGIDAGPNPGAKLHVRNGGSGATINAGTLVAVESNGNQYLSMLAPDSSESGVLFGKPTGGSAAGGIIYNNAGTPDGLQFRTGGNATRASIDSTGRMLLTSAQSGPSMLGLNNFNDQATGVTLTTSFRTWFLAQNRPPDDTSRVDTFYIFDSSANATRLLINTAGNVGIGTTAPGTKLHIVNGTASMNSLQSVNTAAAGGDVGSGVVGGTAQGNLFASGVRGFNSNVSGTGVIGTGNNSAISALPGGSGGAFTGNVTGVAAFSTTAGIGQALYSEQFGVPVRVGFWDGGTFFKINGGGTVSTIVRDVQNQPVTMFAPETPECLLQDFGQGVLVNGFAHIELDPSFARNVLVDPNHPLRIMIQLEDNEFCEGVVVKNKTPHGFDVVELRGGKSTTPFQYQATCNRADETLPGGRVSHYADLRFPSAPAAEATVTAAADPMVGLVQAALEEDRAAPR